MSIMQTLVGRKPWSQRKAELEEKISTIRAQREAFVRERHSLLPAAADGEPAATKRAAFLYDAIGDEDRQIDDLQKVYADASAHVDAEDRTRAAKAEQSRLAAIEASVATWREKAAARRSEAHFPLCLANPREEAARVRSGGEGLRS